MSDIDLKKLDREDKELNYEYRARMSESEELIRLDELLGFKLPETRCLVPSAECGMTAASLMSLVPIYDTVLLPVYSHYWPGEDNKISKISKDPIFRQQHELTPKDLAVIAEKGRVLPYFDRTYSNYNAKTIRPLLEPGIPRISYHTMETIRWMSINAMSREEKWGDSLELASKDIADFEFPTEKEQQNNCIICLSSSYVLGLRKRFQAKEFTRLHACSVSYAITTQVLDAVLQTNCHIAEDVITGLAQAQLPEGARLEYILKGLKVNYSTDIPLEEYVDVFDGKTSRALRKILTDLLKDPLARKYSERLNARIYELNREVKELAESRSAKLFAILSDMALYGGEKFIESQTQRYIRVPKKGLIQLGEWLASKGVSLASKTQRKDWAVAQLFKARCKLKRCE